MTLLIIDFVQRNIFENNQIYIINKSMLIYDFYGQGSMLGYAIKKNTKKYKKRHPLLSV